MKMSKKVIKLTKEVSEWLRESANPHVTIEITDSEVKMTSVEHGFPTTEVKEDQSACSNCARIWRGNNAYCGVCGNQIFPLKDMKVHYPNRNFAIDASRY